MGLYKKIASFIIAVTIFLLLLPYAVMAAGSTEKGAASGSSDEPRSRLSIYVPEGFESWLGNDVNYFSLQNNKAVYLAQDGYGKWAAGYSYGYGTLADAKSVALSTCNEERLASGLSYPCILYAENDRVAYYDLTTEKATISDNLDIYLPSIAFDGWDYSFNLQFHGYDRYGNMYWKLTGMSVNYSPSGNARMSSTTWRISIDSIIFAGVYDLWLTLEYAYYDNGYHYWRYGNLGFN